MIFLLLLLCLLPVVYSVLERKCEEMLFSSYAMPKSRANLACLEKIYVIHWNGNPDREAITKTRLNKILSPNWETSDLVSFVKSLDIETFNTSMIACLGHDSSKIKRGTISVTAKHHLAYYDALQNGYKRILVLEDDIDFAPFFEEKISRVCDSLDQLDTWSNCFISACVRNRCPQNDEPICRNPSGSSNCAYGYIMSNYGAKQHIDNLPLTQAKGGILNPDWVMNLLARHNNKYLSYQAGDLDIAFENALDVDSTWNFKKKYHES